MKTAALIPGLIFLVASGTAQQIKLTDTVILFDDKPVAYFFTDLNKPSQQYNVDVYNLADLYMIKSEVLKFTAPVDQLRSFYYYEMTFPPTSDTLTLIPGDEPFPVVLAKMIRDYRLIEKGSLNKTGISNLRNNCPAVMALQVKIQEQMNYLNQTRYFNEQVVRDRTKPVVLINNRVIMQDGKKIGTIAEFENLQVTNQSVQIQALGAESDFNLLKATRTQIFFENGRQLNYVNDYNLLNRGLSKGQRGYVLYEKSVDKTIVPRSYTDALLQRICFYIEDYGL